MKIVIKVGTSTLTHSTGLINIRHIEALCKIISDIKNMGHEIVLVSSGAIGMGVGKLKLKKRPDDLATKQAAAAVGQCELMYTYDKLFSEYNHTSAQILITDDDVADSERKENFINTLCRLLELDVIPIINENDTVATHQIVLGDNDTLSAIVADCVSADLLVILSDVEGLYDSDPRKNKNAKLIPCVEKITPEIVALGGEAGSSLGTGGMATKIKAAQIARNCGCDTVIANGADPAILYAIVDGKEIGTRFLGKND